MHWEYEIDLRNKKLKGKTQEYGNWCHDAIKWVKKQRIGEEFYLSTDGKSIIRHRVDVVGTWKVKRYPPLRPGE